MITETAKRTTWASQMVNWITKGAPSGGSAFLKPMAAILDDQYLDEVLRHRLCSQQRGQRWIGPGSSFEMLNQARNLLAKGTVPAVAVGGFELLRLAVIADRYDSGEESEDIASRSDILMPVLLGR